MPSPKNIQLLKLLQEKLRQAKATVLADYRGLTVDQLTELRQKVREAGGELMVAKNTLLRLALQSQSLPTPDDQLTGPTIVLFAYEDEIAPLKALSDFAKQYDLPKLKAGLLYNELLTTDRLNQLAKLPGKKELLARFTRLVNAPRVNLVFALRANLQNLVLVLKALQEKKAAN